MLMHTVNYLLKFIFIFINATYLHCLNKTALKRKYWKTAHQPLLRPSSLSSDPLPQIATFNSDTSGVYLYVSK